MVDDNVSVESFEGDDDRTQALGLRHTDLIETDRLLDGRTALPS